MCALVIGILKKQHKIKLSSRYSMPRLTQHEKSEALDMLRAGSGPTEVARLYNCHRQTIIRLQHRFQQTGTINDRPRMGQPRVKTRQQDGILHYIMLIVTSPI